MHFDWWTLALQTVNVLVLIWLLDRFFFRPVMNIVAKRQAEANKLLSDAASARQDAAAIRGDAEKARAEIGAERDRLIAEARQGAGTEKENLLAQSSQEIAKLRSEAEAAIARDRTMAGKAVVAHARELSVEIAERLLARFPPSIAFAAFLDGLCREMQVLSPEAKASLAGATADDAVEVITAAPLSATESGCVRDALNRLLGSETAFEFRVDPALIAGIEVHSRNTIVRNNWRADLDRIGEELGRDDRAPDLDRWLNGAKARVRATTLAPAVEQVGRIEAVADCIAQVSGLDNVRLDELVRFERGQVGFALTLDRDSVGCVLLDDAGTIEAGDRARGTGEVVRVPVGEALLGRIVDPLGRPVDGGGAIEAERYDPVERPAPAIVDRDFVSEPVQTGSLVVDSMFALGRGQRELIIGSRAIGKTAIAVDCIINQKASDIVCVYIAVGQKSSTVKRVISAIRARGAPERCIVVAAGASTVAGLQWIAPYAGFTMAEYFRDRGQHALVVIDDMTKHAATHREIALLTRQSPGREAFPGDVFYIHARLLERAAKLSKAAGGGSLTALPIAELDAGNLSAYIPTNLISITDGQIVLDERLFHEGHKPAVDVGTSVSRVGGKAQAPALRKAAETLRLDYAQFLELEVFTRFGSVTDVQVRGKIEHGKRIRACLSQLQYAPLRLADEVALVLALQSGILDRLPLEQIGRFRSELPRWLDDKVRPLVDGIERTGLLDEAGSAELRAGLAALAARLAPPAAPKPEAP